MPPSSGKDPGPARGRSADAEAWYILRLRPGGLDRAVANLARQGVRTYCPERERTQRRNGRLVTRPRPLFPGYLFISPAAATPAWRSINATYGVASVVCLEPGRPARVPEGLVPALMAFCDQPAGGRADAAFAPGDEVRIVLGPFAEMTARIEALPEADRIHVLLDMMGRRVRACVAPGQLEKVA